MVISLNIVPKKLGKFVGKNKKTGEILLKNANGVIISITTPVYYIWKLVNGRKSIGQIIEEFMEFYGIYAENPEELILEILEELKKASLVSF